VQTSYPNLVNLLDKKTGKDIDKLAARDSNVAHALVLLDRDIPAFNQVEGFSKECKDPLKDAISNAVNKGNFERLADFLAEVEVGRMFLKTGLLERHEAPLEPTEERPPKKKSLSCDWRLVTVNNERIWVEVKRIRRTQAEKDLQQQIRKVAGKIKAIPSPFSVDLRLDSFHLQPPAVDRIVEEIAKTLAEMKAEDSRVEKQPIWLNDNGKETRLGTFSVAPKGQYSQDKATAFSCFSWSVPYSEDGSERKKFWSDLTDKGKKLQKLPDNEAGFIFFWVDSGTHEEIDLLGLLEGRLYGAGDSLQGWSRWQINEFFKDYRKVTGVIIRTERVIASVTSPGTISWGSRDQKRYKIHWNPWSPWVVNERNKTTAAMFEELLG
jgi:hypothetical protein